MKKFAIIFSCLLVLMALPVYAKEFNDVPTTHWAHQYISELSDQGVINGYQDGSYKPSNQVTRGEFYKLVMTALYGEDYYKEYSKKYTDFHWAYAYQRDAASKGYLDLMDSMRELDSYVDRFEMSTFLSSVVKNNEKLSNFKSENAVHILDFKDINLLSYEDMGKMNRAVSVGLLNGYDDMTFKPYKQMTRAEVATVIYRLNNMLK